METNTQPLTKEQYEKARQSFSDEQIRVMEKRRMKTMNNISPQAQQQEEPEQRGFVESLVKRPVERLVMEPGRRTTEALIASLPVVPKDIRNAALDQSTEDKSLHFPLLGEFITRGSGDTKQTVGEALETASWLYAPRKGIEALSQGVGGSVRTGMQAGLVGGGLFGAGDALQQDEDGQEVLKQGAVGAGLGVVGGAAIGGVLGGAASVGPAAVRTGQEIASHGYGLAESVAGSVMNMGKSISGKATEMPKRVVRRTAEDVADMASRNKKIRNSPQHIAEAMKQGIENPVIEFVKTGTKAEKQQRAEMLEIAKRATEDLTKLESAKTIPGKAIIDGPVDFLVKNAKRGTAQTESVLKSLPTQPQEFRNLQTQVIDDLSNIGLEIQGGELIRVRGSRVPDADLPFYERIVSELIPDDGGSVNLNYRQLDALRDRWYNSVKTEQTFTQGVKGRTGYLNRVRALLTKEIDAAAGGSYREAQQTTAESLQSLSEFVRLIGYKGPLDEVDSKALKAGEKFIRVFGNASDRPVSALNSLYDTAKKYGYEGQENAINQLRFVDMLESVYGQPSRSLGGQMSKASSDASDPQQIMASSIREMVKWSPYSGMIRFLKARGLLGRHEREVIRSFENLVRGEAGLPMQKRSSLPLEDSVARVKDEVQVQVDKVKGLFGN